MLLSEAFEQYRLEVVVLMNMSSRTEESVKTSQRVFTSYFKDLDITDLTIDHIRQWHVRQLGRKLSPDTIRGYLLHMRVVLRHCKLKGISVLDPALITVPKRQPKVPDFLEPKDVDVLIESFSKCRGRSKEATLRNKAIISLLYASGMRCDELCSLLISNVHERRATIVGKGNKPRLVFWDERSECLIRDYLAIRKDNKPHLFVSPNTKKKLSRHDIGDIFRWLQKNTEYKNIHAHTLRHTYATHLAQNGMPIHSLQRLLGHANLSTTSQYLHVSDIRLEEEYARFHT